MIMGKTLRSNRTRGGKTRKNIGGAPLDNNSEIDIKLYLHDGALYMRPLTVKPLNGTWRNITGGVFSNNAEKYRISNNGISIREVVKASNLTDKIELGKVEGAWNSQNYTGITTRKSEVISATKTDADKKALDNAKKELDRVIKVFDTESNRPKTRAFNAGNKNYVKYKTALEELKTELVYEKEYKTGTKNIDIFGGKLDRSKIDILINNLNKITTITTQGGVFVKWGMNRTTKIDKFDDKDILNFLQSLFTNTFTNDLKK